MNRNYGIISMKLWNRKIDEWFLEMQRSPRVHKSLYKSQALKLSAKSMWANVHRKLSIMIVNDVNALPEIIITESICDFIPGKWKPIVGSFWNQYWWICIIHSFIPFEVDERYFTINETVCREKKGGIWGRSFGGVIWDGFIELRDGGVDI